MFFVVVVVVVVVLFFPSSRYIRTFRYDIIGVFRNLTINCLSNSIFASLFEGLCFLPTFERNPLTSFPFVWSSFKEMFLWLEKLTTLDSLLKRKYVNKKNVRGFSKINLGGR